MEKISLYKFNYIPLLKNDTQLKQKSDKQVKKKINHPNLLKTKNHVQLKKEKEQKQNKSLSPHALGNQKKKKR